MQARTGHHHQRPITATPGTEAVSRCARYRPALQPGLRAAQHGSRYPYPAWSSPHVELPVPARPLGVPPPAAGARGVAGRGIGAIAIAPASGGKTNDNFTIPGTESQNAAAVLQAKLPAFSGGQTTVVFATTDGAPRSPIRPPGPAIEPAMAKLAAIPQVSAVAIPSRASWSRRAARSRSGRCSGRHGRPTSRTPRWTP